MTWEMVSSGSILDAAQMQDYDGFLAEGQRGKLEVDLSFVPGADIVNWLQSEMLNRGVTDARVSTGSPMLNIEFRKTFFWLPVIAALVLILAILIVGWRFFREIVEVIPPDTLNDIIKKLGTGTVIALICVAAIGTYNLTKKGR
jgi:hypothetical protein